MEKFKKNLPIILLSVCATLLLVAVILLINGNRFSFNNNASKEQTKENNTKTIKENTTNSKSTNENTDTNTTNTNSNNNSNNSNTSNNSQPTSTPVSTPSATPEPTPIPKEESKVSEENIPGDENSVVSYFENISNMNNNDTSLSEKIKNGFVTIIDFIFYGKEIKGHTFKELTTTAKIKVIAIALKIDNKIDSYFPGYKDKLSEKYKSVKEKLASLYAEYTVKACEKIGEENCNKLKEDFDKMKTNFGIAGDYLKDAFSKASSKLKEWYENWRDK